MDELNIPMPGEEEKRRSVAQILDAGLPKRTGLWRELSGAMRTAGIGTMFFGVWDCLALSALIWALCIFPSSFLSEASGQRRARRVYLLARVLRLALTACLVEGPAVRPV